MLRKVRTVIREREKTMPFSIMTFAGRYGTVCMYCVRVVISCIKYAAFARTKLLVDRKIIVLFSLKFMQEQE